MNGLIFLSFILLFTFNLTFGDLNNSFFLFKNIKQQNRLNTFKKLNVYFLFLYFFLIYNI